MFSITFLTAITAVCTNIKFLHMANPAKYYTTGSPMSQNLPLVCLPLLQN